MRRISLAAACFLLSTLAAASQTPPSPSDGPPMGSKLPPGDGRELVMRVCSKCHTPDIVADQFLDAQGWKELVNQMASNGAQGTDAEFDQITAYLTTSFPAK
jgi:mono/diheme cytochrome c family protein